MKREQKLLIVIGIPVISLLFFGIAYIEALGQMASFHEIEYREDCDTVNPSVFNNGVYSLVCDLREQNEKLIEQNDILILEAQKQTALLDQSNCYNFYINVGGIITKRQIADRCGEPLNFTGAYTPP